MDKKGILIPIMTIMSIVVLVAAYTSFVNNKSEDYDKVLGTSQLSIFSHYLQGEFALLYIDQTAKLVGEQSIKQLGRQGGMADVSACKDHQGFIELYSSPQCDWNPAQLRENHVTLFAKNFKTKLQNNPYFIEPGTYELTPGVLENVTVHGKARQSHVISSEDITYTVYPVFSQTYDYSFDDYQTILQELTKNYPCLKATTQAIAQTCKLSDQFDWNIEKQGDMLTVVATSKEALLFAGNIDVRFSINLNNLIQNLL